MLSSEYNSSKRSACCHCKVHDTVAQKSRLKRATVFVCDGCNTLLSRDVSVSFVIKDIFEYQCTNQTKELPEWAKSEKKKKVTCKRKSVTDMWRRRRHCH